MSKLKFLKDETINEFIYRIGNEKVSDLIDATWKDVSDAIKNRSNGVECLTPNACIKRFTKMRSAANDVNKLYQEDDTEKASDEEVINIIREDVIARDEKNASARLKRDIAREFNLYQALKDTIKPLNPVIVNFRDRTEDERAVYALFSDIHYGLMYDNAVGTFNPEIATQRIEAYTAEIIRIGIENHANTCYLSLMGDLYHGCIHQSMMRENVLPIDRQIADMSQNVTSMLMSLAKHFNTVYVNSVGGNHSRILPNADDNLRNDRLDGVCFYVANGYCKDQCNIIFDEGNIDSTIGMFTIFGKNYFCVHGDMDKDIKNISHNIENLSKEKVDYVVAGHKHFSSYCFDKSNYIQNGCLCGTGDDYSVKNRFYSEPSQTVLLVDKTGVRAIYPVRL